MLPAAHARHGNETFTPVLKASQRFYGSVMFGPSQLSRGQREMLAVVVSRTTGCRY